MKLTVITINYNNKVGLERTIKSVINQSYQDFEYIIIDGASTDGSRELIENYSGKISYWVSESDNGIYNAMNKGVRAATGEYLLFINSGDELYKLNVLEEIIPSLHSTSIISGGLVIDFAGREEFRNAKESISFQLFIDDTIYHPSTFVKKSCFEQYGFYDENLRIVSDWKWFMIVLTKFNESYKGIQNIVSRFYTDGISSQVEHQNLIALEKRTVLEKNYFYFLADYERSKEMKIELESIKRSKYYKGYLILKKMKNSLKSF